MRGNHRIWGRNDYNEPAPMTREQQDKVASVTLTRTPNRRTWHDVFLNGGFIGQVSMAAWGQFFKPPGAPEKTLAASNWNSADPPHGWAILRLIEIQEHTK